MIVDDFVAELRNVHTSRLIALMQMNVLVSTFTGPDGLGWLSEEDRIAISQAVMMEIDRRIPVP